MRWRYLPSKRRAQRASLLHEIEQDNLCRAAIERDGRMEAEWQFSRGTAERLLPPEAVFLRGNHRLYGEYSDRVMAILGTFTPDVEQVSVDEAYMDVTGCLHFWPGPAAKASAMKERIRQECGLTVSVGIASNTLCAKIAAGLKKPDGLIIVPPGTEREFLVPLPIETVPAWGRKRSRG